MSIFSTDPSFCPHCGTILPLPGEGAIVTCKLCEFRQDTTGELRRSSPLFAPLIINAHVYGCSVVYERLEEYSYKYFASRREAPRLSSEGEGPLVLMSIFHSINKPKFAPYKDRPVSEHAIFPPPLSRWSGVAPSVVMKRCHTAHNKHGLLMKAKPFFTPAQNASMSTPLTPTP